MRSQRSLSRTSSRVRSSVGTRGRKQKYQSAAEKQRAYRSRKRLNADPDLVPIPVSNLGEPLYYSESGLMLAKNRSIKCRICGAEHFTIRPEVLVMDCPAGTHLHERVPLSSVKPSPTLRHRQLRNTFELSVDE